MSAIKSAPKSHTKRPQLKENDAVISLRELFTLLEKKALKPYREDRFLRLDRVLSKVGLSRSVLYRMIEKGHFPMVIKINGSTSVWSENAVNDWMDERKQEAEL